MSPTDIRTLVDHYINAYNRKDIDDMLIGVHPQVEFKNISAGVVNASTNGVAELIPNTTKKIHYIVGSTLIFSKASETNSIAVKEAKNSFDFDWNR